MGARPRPRALGGGWGGEAAIALVCDPSPLCGGTRAGESSPFRAERPVGTGPPAGCQVPGGRDLLWFCARSEAFSLWPARWAKPRAGTQRRAQVGAGREGGLGLRWPEILSLCEQRPGPGQEPNRIRSFAHSRHLIKVERVLASARGRSLERPESHVSGGGAAPGSEGAGAPEVQAARDPISQTWGCARHKSGKDLIKSVPSRCLCIHFLHIASEY